MIRTEPTGASAPDTAAATPGGDDRSPRTMGFTELKTWLRHRHPMVYVDRVVDHEPGEFLTGLVSVSGALDVVAGHFPERAIFPASHLSQAVAQCAIILYQLGTRQLADDELTLIGSLHSRFTSVIVPGDQVLLHVQVARLRETTLSFTCRATVDGRRVAALRGTLVRTSVESLGRQLW
jgi:3-hydroxymyristoyl/3-hydroxydecanoyl-(acyl carrier protein) dehydratase